MPFIRYLIVFLAALNFGYMLFDGSRALVKGDYIRPTGGEYAGQLGPWAKLVSRLGIEPGSTLMKGVFMFWGGCGLALTACFALKLGWAPRALLAFNLLSMWYLWMGSISSLVQAVLLLLFFIF